MNKNEDILNEAIAKLRTEHSVEQVLSAYPELEQAEKNELRSMLALAHSLVSLPKKDIPEPSMRRAYIFAPVQSTWLSWLPLSRLATASMSVIMLMTAMVGTGFAAWDSTAGQPLFRLKKTVENLELAFAKTPESKANIQVEITKKRLTEAQEIFQNPSSDPGEEQAALRELFTATKDSIEAVSSAAQTNAVYSTDHPTLASLDTITRQQQVLVKQSGAKNEIALAATNAVATAQENSEKVEQIKKYVEVASNAQALAQLSPNPNVVNASGTIFEIDKTSLTVDKIVFTFSDTTTFKDEKGNTIKPSALALNAKITVTGTKNDNGGITAQSIALGHDLDSIYPAIVKGASTSSSSSTISLTKTATSTATSAKKIGEASSTTETILPNPNTAVGSFITEDPSPQLHN